MASMNRQAKKIKRMLTIQEERNIKGRKQMAERRESLRSEEYETLMKQIQKYHRALTLCNKIMEDEESASESDESSFSGGNRHISEEVPDFSVSESRVTDNMSPALRDKVNEGEQKKLKKKDSLSDGQAGTDMKKRGVKRTRSKIDAERYKKAIDEFDKRASELGKRTPLPQKEEILW